MSIPIRLSIIWLTSILLAASANAQNVCTGLDVLEQNQFLELKGQRVGLITNHTGRNREGAGIVKLFDASTHVDLVALFSPEHGFEGKLDVAKIDDASDQTTGLKIYSLYGKTRKPTAEMLADVDTLVFDIQDIGTRFYTYISTMGEAMNAAAEHGKRFVVLDRPNPIGGLEIAGPMLDAGRESFVGFHSLPVRHGMTAGELARMFRGELGLDVELVVVKCSGWQRRQLWNQTGLTWVNPSPNMRCLTQAMLYPGIGLMEMTNVSVGRGTDTPFEVLGAPWMDGRQLAAELNARRIPGVSFVPIEFTPDSSKFDGQLCDGINIVVTEWNEFEPLRTGFEVATAVRKLYSEHWKSDAYLRLLGNQAVLHAVQSGKSAAEVLDVANEGVDEFRTRRAAHLLYD